MRSGLRSPMQAKIPDGLHRSMILACTLLGLLGFGCISCSAQIHNSSPLQATISKHPTAASQNFDAFAGSWAGHSRGLDIRPDGEFTLSIRTYRVCGQDPPPCDHLSGDVLVYGDRASGQLSSVVGRVATGVIRKTTDPADTPTGQLVMTLDTAADTIIVDGMLYCGPSAAGGYCGA